MTRGCLRPNHLVGNVLDYPVFQIDVDGKEMESVGLLLIIYNCIEGIVDACDTTIVAWRNSHAADVCLST